MSIEIVTLLLFGSLFALFAIGIPISFCLLIVGIVFGVLLWGPAQLYVVASSMFGATTSQVLIAVPLFVLMGNALTFTGIAGRLFQALYYWLGPVRGGLAMAVEAIGAIFAAMCGSSAAGTITMGTIALPEMMKRGYNQKLAIGTVASGGLLGILIPPSIIAIIYASIAGVSIGKLYLGMFGPGLMLAGLYIVYIGILCHFVPGMGPGIPKAEMPSWGKKFRSLKDVLAPLLIVVAVLGGIYTGIATPTEAAGIGAICIFIAAILDRSLSWKSLRETLLQTTRLTAMVVWLMMGVTVFSSVHNALGAPDLINHFVTSLPINGFGVVILMQISIFILGCIMDDVAIILLCTPLYVPIIQALGFDPLWFGVLVMVNMQCAWLTPPYGFNLFYMRAICPPEVRTETIWASVVPFIGLQIVVLATTMFFPPIATWLPATFIGK